PAAVPPPPAECRAFAEHPTAGCIPAGKAREMLAAAVAPARSPLERDAALACLEESGDFADGLLRALRAELSPVVCADAIAAPLVEKPPKKLALDVEGTLLGLVLSARLERLLGNPPELASPFSKERFLAFQRDELAPWIVSQALAIDQLSVQGARLTGYGRGIAAIASGNADLRFVETVREIPLPEEIRADRELADVYYGSLDEALEPRKQRGRDAALAGLRVFAELGAIGDPRVERARTLLSKLWAGSRVDALDALLVPALPPEKSSGAEGELAGALPTFYSTRVLSAGDAQNPDVLRAFAARGVPKPFRDALDPKKISPPARLVLSMALVDSGRRYFRAADFRRAREVLAQGKVDDAGHLLSALAVALARGPEDTAELMLKGPGVKGAFDVSALDAIAKQNGVYAGAAAFDAAYVLGLVPKPDDPAFWDDLGARFEMAQKLLSEKKAPLEEREHARKYAEGARATARALRDKR
ncbi:MAG TPA: hypothetical protein VMS65_04470, partial [Polyangiaceae bacterium]|nr:hypothetical protein [Polyangiaceae bacterium]